MQNLSCCALGLRQRVHRRLLLPLLRAVERHVPPSPTPLLSSRTVSRPAGIPEDPVTGSAHTVLAPYWSALLHKLSFSARQVSSCSAAAPRRFPHVCEHWEVMFYSGIQERRLVESVAGTRQNLHFWSRCHGHCRHHQLCRIALLPNEWRCSAPAQVPA